MRRIYEAMARAISGERVTTSLRLPSLFSFDPHMRASLPKRYGTRREQPMDDAKTRDHINQHADAVVRGDMDALAADFSEELRPQMAQIAQALPQPVTAAEVLSVDVGDSEGVAMIRYSGETDEVTIRSRWQDQGGRPVIVQAEPAG
jgi:hypothetical protein